MVIEEKKMGLTLTLTLLLTLTLMGYQEDGDRGKDGRNTMPDAKLFKIFRWYIEIRDPEFAG